MPASPVATTINGNDEDPISTVTPDLASPATDPPTASDETTTRGPTETSSSAKRSALSARILFVGLTGWILVLLPFLGSVHFL